MSRRARPLASLVLAALGAACAPTYRFTVPTHAPVTAACLFHGPWTYGVVLGARSHVPFADVSAAEADGALERNGSGLVLRVAVLSHGWTLRGTTDLADGGALRLQRMVGLGGVLTAHPGASISVTDARPGQALVGPGRFAFGLDQGDVRFVADPTRWVPCDALGFAYTFRDEHTEDRERAAMGFTGELPTREIAPTASVDLTAAPGGAPQVHVNPRESGIGVRSLGTDGAFTRVLLQHWTGFALVAWLPTAALGAESEGGFGGLMGGLGASDRRSLTVCRAPVDVTFGFTHAGAPLEHAGSVAAGTEFVRGASTADGGFVIAPYPRGASPHAVQGVTWVAHAAVALSCREVVE